MIKLTRFLEVPFDGDISITELLSFSTDHLQRMIANNPSSALDARITATTAALASVTDNVTDDETKLAIRMARKQSKDDFRAALAARVAKIGGAVTAQFGPDGAEVTECFPLGRTIFSRSPDDQMAGHLQTLINGVTVYVAELGAPVVADATSLLTGWNLVYTKSEEATGAKTTTQEEKRVARSGLQLALFLNLLKLAELFPRQPEKLPLYMRQSLLGDTGGGNPPVG